MLKSMCKESNKEEKWKIVLDIEKSVVHISSIDSVIGKIEEVVKELADIQETLKMPSEEKFKCLSGDFIQNLYVSTRKENKYWAL